MGIGIAYCIGQVAGHKNLLNKTGSTFLVVASTSPPSWEWSNEMMISSIFIFIYFYGKTQSYTLGSYGRGLVFLTRWAIACDEILCCLALLRYINIYFGKMLVCSCRFASSFAFIYIWHYGCVVVWLILYSHSCLQYNVHAWSVSYVFFVVTCTFNHLTWFERTDVHLVHFFSWNKQPYPIIIWSCKC